MLCKPCVISSAETSGGTSHRSQAGSDIRKPTIRIIECILAAIYQYQLQKLERNRKKIKSGQIQHQSELIIHKRTLSAPQKGVCLINNMALAQETINTIAQQRHYYYLQLSTDPQERNVQIERMQSHGATEYNLISDREGRHAEYKIFKQNFLQPENILTVEKLSDLGRTAREVYEELTYYKKQGIKVQGLDIPSTLEPHGYSMEWLDYMLTDMLIETMDAMESIKRLERRDHRKAGIDALKGTPAWKNYGRPKQPLPENYDVVMKRWKNREITAVVAMRLTGLKRTKFYELAKEWEAKS